MKINFYHVFSSVTFFVVIIYLVSCLSPFVNPSVFWPLTFLALGFPIIACFVLVIMIAWLFVYKRISICLLIVFFLGYNSLKAVFALNPGALIKPSQNKTLRILSWNVNGFGNNARHAEHPDSTRRKMINFLKEQQADILLLQEFVNYQHPTIYSNTQTLRDSLGYRYCYAPSDVTLYMSYGPVTFGNAIFSKYPLTDTTSLVYKGLALPEHAISGSIIYNKHSVRLITTHLVSMNLNKGPLFRTDEAYKNYDSAFIHGTSKIIKLKVYDKLHASQAAQLKQFAGKFSLPIILSGDFNSVPSSFTYHTIKGEMQDAFLCHGFGFGRTYGSLSPTLRIDYILADKSLKISSFKCLPLRLSDHYPLVADITLEQALFTKPHP